MSHRKQRNSKEDFAERSAKLVHDVTTPVAIIKVNNELIARHLPALLSAYESQLNLRHPDDTVIPPEHLQAMRKSPTLVMEQCARVEQLVKAHWKEDQQAPSASAKSPDMTGQAALARRHHLDILLVDNRLTSWCDKKAYLRCRPSFERLHKRSDLDATT